MKDIHVHCIFVIVSLSHFHPSPFWLIFSEQKLIDKVSLPKIRSYVLLYHYFKPMLIDPKGLVFYKHTYKHKKIHTKQICTTGFVRELLHLFLSA